MPAQPAASAMPGLPRATTAPMARDRTPANPFDEDRLNDAADYRPAWDVPSLNADASRWLEAQVRAVSADPEGTAARKIAVLLAQAGYGKTHLFGRVADALGQQVVFAFVGPILEAQLATPLQHVRWNVVEALFEPTPGNPSWVTQLLARLTRGSFEQYFNALPDLLRTRHAALRQRLADDPLAVMEVLTPVGELAPYQRLADSLAAGFPALQADVVRAIALGWSPAGLEARRWLRGDDLPEQECRRLRLGEEPPGAERVIEAIATLLRRVGVPLVVCCDQLEAVLKQPAVGPIHLSDGLVGLLQTVPNLMIVLGCLEDAWKRLLAQNLHESFLHRVHPPLTLATLSDAQAVDLVERRIAGWKHGDSAGVGDPLWPIRGESILAFSRLRPQPPRALVKACKSAVDDWLTSRDGAAVDIVKIIDEPLADLFVRHWNQELDKVRRRARSPEDVQEAELFQGVHEALRIAQLAGHAPPGMRITGLAEGAVKATKTDARPSLGVSIQAGVATTTVVVAVSKKDGGPAFATYVTALRDAAKPDSVAGAVLVRPKAELSVGPAAQARKLYEQSVSDGSLRPFALEQERQTFEQLECLMSVLQDADDGMLVGKATLMRPDVVKLIVETGLLKSLKLFEFVLGNWAGMPAADAAVARPDALPGATPTMPAAQPTVAPRPLPAAAPFDAAAPTAPASNPAGTPDDTLAWAEQLLEKVVDKYRRYGLPVRPLGVQIGPTFVRLKIHPSDMTDLNKVRNKADNLRVSLGLPARPLIGLQAGYVSVDVQLPRRTPVPLAPLLAARPPALRGRLAFPAGVDVAGRAHWLDLADTASCHLLIAGTTGSGKSEFMKVILAALADAMGPAELQFVLIDPKRVTFNLRDAGPYLRAPIAHDNLDALPLIESCVDEMERRYRLLEARRLSHVEELTGADAVPRIVLMFDEFADLMADKAGRRELEPLLKRLGAKARASGIHLILGTQRTEAGVVTPLLRSNLPGRISLKVTSERDSNLILDAPGAADLLGKGDLLWRQGGDLVRLQSALVSNAEVEAALRGKSE